MNLSDNISSKQIQKWSPLVGEDLLFDSSSFPLFREGKTFEIVGLKATIDIDGTGYENGDTVWFDNSGVFRGSAYGSKSEYNGGLTTVEIQSTDYTLRTSDIGKILVFTAATNVIVRVSDNLQDNSFNCILMNDLTQKRLTVNAEASVVVDSVGDLYDVSFNGTARILPTITINRYKLTGDTELYEEGATNFIVTEGGDTLTTESGDNIITEDNN